MTLTADLREFEPISGESRDAYLARAEHAFERFIREKDLANPAIPFVRRQNLGEPGTREHALFWLRMDQCREQALAALRVYIQLMARTTPA